MVDYKKMYLTLFNAITDAIRDFQAGKTAKAVSRLVEAQQVAEEIYMDTDELGSH